MVTNELLEFIQLHLHEGISEADIERVLLRDGNWTKTDVTEAFHMLGARAQTSGPVPPEFPTPADIVAAAHLEPTDAYALSAVAGEGALLSLGVDASHELTPGIVGALPLRGGRFSSAPMDMSHGAPHTQGVSSTLSPVSPAPVGHVTPADAILGIEERPQSPAAPSFVREFAPTSVTPISLSPVGVTPSGSPSPRPAPVHLAPAVTAAPPVPRPAKKIPPMPRTRSLGRTLAVAGGAVIALVGIGAGALFLYRTVTTGGDPVAAGLSSLSEAPGFAYDATLSVDLSLTPTMVGSDARAGSAHANIRSTGNVNLASGSIEDGAHHVAFDGTLASGNFNWSSAFEADVRRTAGLLFLHATTPPHNDAIDPDLLKAYWIRIIEKDLPAEFFPSKAATGGYGAFSGSSSDGFLSLLVKDYPLRTGVLVGEETIDGVATRKYRASVDPDKALTLADDLVRSYSGAAPAWTEDDRVRLRGLLERVTVTVWVGKDDTVVHRISLVADPNDEISGERIAGHTDLSLTFSNIGTTVAIEQPSPVLSVTEFQERLADFGQQNAARLRDTELVDEASTIVAALDRYAAEHARYPSALAALTSGGYLDASAVAHLGLFSYVPFMKDGNADRGGGKCLAKGNVCPLYHLGITLEDPKHPALSADADMDGILSGLDSAGCQGEKGKACYDIAKDLRR